MNDSAVVYRTDWLKEFVVSPLTHGVFQAWCSGLPHAPWLKAILPLTINIGLGGGGEGEERKSCSFVSIDVRHLLTENWGGGKFNFKIKVKPKCCVCIYVLTINILNLLICTLHNTRIRLYTRVVCIKVWNSSIKIWCTLYSANMCKCLCGDSSHKLFSHYTL